MNSTDESSQKNVSQNFKTPFGINEEVFVRTAKQGDYTPLVHEVDRSIIQNELSLYEIRVVFYIKSKCVDFRNTHFRSKRKTIQESLGISKCKLFETLRSLIAKEYILEKLDEDNYYFYAIHPRLSPIVLRSVKEATYRVNRQYKSKEQLISVTQKVTEWYLKGNEVLPKRYPEDKLTIQNYTPFETLKYILLKYILLNKHSLERGHKILQILEESKGPIFLIQGLTRIMQKSAHSSRAILEEILRASRERTNVQKFALTCDPAFYAISQWEAIKREWERIDHKWDEDELSVQIRQELYELIQSYPSKENVIPFQRKEKRA